MAAPMTLDQAIKFLDKVADEGDRAWQRAFRKTATIIRKEAKRSWEAHEAPDGTPWNPFRPAAPFARGDIWFTTKRASNPDGTNQKIIPRKIRSARMARKATAEWNKKWRSKRNVTGKAKRSLPPRPRGGRDLAALYRKSGDQAKGLFRAMTRTKAPGHVERIDGKSLTIGVSGIVAAVLHEGDQNIPSRPILGANERMLEKIVQVFADEYLRKIKNL